MIHDSASMIGYLSGEIKSIGEGFVIVEVSGVGYKVQVGDFKWKVGDEAELFVYTHVRENELSLYGFESSEELELFELLLTVSGVGPKAAVALVTQLGVEKLSNAIALGEVEGIKAPGVGKKTAEKIVVELREKIKPVKAGIKQVSIRDIAEHSEKLAEVEQALGSLGYSRPEIKRWLGGLGSETLNKSGEELVRLGLKELGR